MQSKMPEPELSILVHSPLPSDTAAIARRLTADGLRVTPCSDLEQMAADCDRGCGCLVLTSEALLDRGRRAHLRAAIDTAAGRALMPVVLLTGNPVTQIASRVAAAILGQAAIVHSFERPVSPAALLTAVRDAVGVRQRTLAIPAAEAELRLDELLGFGLIRIDPTAHRVMHANTIALQLLDCSTTELDAIQLDRPPFDVLLPPLERLMAQGRTQQTTIQLAQRDLRVFLCRHEAKIAVLLQDTCAAAINPTNTFLHDLMESHLAMLAHDMKGPLRQSLMWQDLLAEDSLSNAQRDMLDRSSQALLRLIDLIDHSLGRTRPVGPVVCDPAEVLTAVEEDLAQDLAEAHGRIVITDLPRLVPMSAADLGRVLLNLAHNALRYRSERSPEIRVTGDADAQRCVLRLTDNGIGIEAGLLPHIFAQGQVGRTGESRGGTGMGLAICRDLVGRAGGRIWAEATVDVGSTFIIELPSAKHGAT